MEYSSILDLTSFHSAVCNTLHFISKSVLAAFHNLAGKDKSINGTGMIDLWAISQSKGAVSGTWLDAENIKRHKYIYESQSAHQWGLELSPSIH